MTKARNAFKTGVVALTIGLMLSAAMPGSTATEAGEEGQAFEVWLVTGEPGNNTHQLDAAPGMLLESQFSVVNRDIVPHVLHLSPETVGDWNITLSGGAACVTLNPFATSGDMYNFTMSIIPTANATLDENVLVTATEADDGCPDLPEWRRESYASVNVTLPIDVAVTVDQATYGTDDIVTGSVGTVWNVTQAPAEGFDVLVADNPEIGFARSATVTTDGSGAAAFEFAPGLLFGNMPGAHTVRAEVLDLEDVESRTTYDVSFP